MWELDCEESWVPKNWCFWTVVLEKTLESPVDSRRSNQSILKEISPGCSLEGLMLKLKLQYFGHLMGRVERKKVKMKLLSRAPLFATPWIVACTKLLHPWDFQGKSTGVGCGCLLWNGMLLGHKKECIWVNSNEVDEPRVYYTEWSKSERKR